MLGERRRVDVGDDAGYFFSDHQFDDADVFGLPGQDCDAAELQRHDRLRAAR